MHRVGLRDLAGIPRCDGWVSLPRILSFLALTGIHPYSVKTIWKVCIPVCARRSGCCRPVELGSGWSSGDVLLQVGSQGPIVSE